MGASLYSSYEGSLKWRATCRAAAWADNRENGLGGQVGLKQWQAGQSTQFLTHRHLANRRRANDEDKVFRLA